MGEVPLPVLADADLHIEDADTKNKWRTLWKIKFFWLWALYAVMGVTSNGYDFSIFGNLLAFQSFSKKFGELDPATGTYIVSASRQVIWNTAGIFAQAIGGLFSGWAMDKIGRKKWYLACSSFGIIGIGIVYAAEDWKVFAGGRVILGFGVGFSITVGPLYLGENAVPELRGFFLCTTNSFICLGQFMIAVVSRGVVNIEGEWQYKSLILSMLFFNIAVLVFWPWFPESPYYMITHHKNPEGCRKSLRRLYGPWQTQEFIDNEVIRLQHTAKVSAVLAAHSRETRPKAIEALKGTNLRRTLTAFFAAASQQYTGIIFVVGYLPYFLTLAGIANPFSWNMGVFAVSIVANMLGYYTIESFGRRKFIVGGLGLMALCNFIIGFLNISPSAAKLNATIAFIFIFAFLFQTTIGPLGMAFASEIGTPSLRHVSQAIITFSQAFNGWLWSFCIPYMINPDSGNLGGKIGFVFGSTGSIFAIIAFFFFGETKGLTFSEIDLLYADRTSPRHFVRAITEKRAAGLIETDVHHQTPQGGDTEATASHSENAESVDKVEISMKV